MTIPSFSSCASVTRATAWTTFVARRRAATSPTVRWAALSRSGSRRTWTSGMSEDCTSIVPTSGSPEMAGASVKAASS